MSSASNKKAKPANAQASGFRDGYIGSSAIRTDNSKRAAYAKGKAIEVIRAASSSESDPIEDDDEDIAMGEAYFEEGASEGEKEEGGEIEVIDVDAFPSSSEDGDVLPFGDGAEVSCCFYELSIDTYLACHPQGK